MLILDIPETELYNRDTQEFTPIKPQHLVLEHSLISISKWEAKWKKSFLSYSDKTLEMTYDYIRQMTINHNVDDRVYSVLPDEILKKINDYLNDPMTATTFHNINKRPSKQKSIITSEVIYYQMFSYQIPIECEKWHINRLLTLLKVCELKNNPKKLSREETMRQNAALNKIRRAKYRTRG